MRRVLLLLLLFALHSSAQTEKKYRGLLWKITGGELKKPSYLYGTMHVSNRVAYYLSEQFFDALRSVDVVGLETNPGEWLQNMEKTGELDELTQMRSGDEGRNFYKTAFAMSFPERQVFQSILSYDPDIINGLLYRQNQTRENFEESTYIDLFIYQTASKLNKKVISLEDFTASEIKSRLSSLPDEEQDKKNYQIYGAHKKLEDAYREGDLDLLDSLSRLASSANMQRYLIEDRNVFFVNTIDSVMKHSTIFSGVGAAHLPGEKGVIELLRAKGYKVEAIEPTVSKKSNREREELDQQFKPVSFSRQYASDSLFSVETPGKLFTILDAGALKYSIHPDMVNGNFYTVVRLRHAAPLFNITSDQVRAKVDSLLFEHIPGRILSREDIESGGFKGIEIKNRTRQGDEQRYRIFFTDEEMIMFKLGGRFSYASSKEADQFFNSISFREPKTGPILFTPPTGGFTVQVPGRYHYMKYSYAGATGLVEDLFATEQGKVRGIRQAVYNDFDYLEVDTFELNQMASAVLESFQFNTDRTFSITTLQTFPSIRFWGRSNSGVWLNAQISIKGVHYYLVYATADSAGDFSHNFFTSFKLGEFRYINPIKSITDPDFGFRALDEVTDDARSRFNEAYKKAYEEARGIKEDTVDPREYRSGSKLYYSPSSNEYLSISYEKFSTYDYRDPKTVEELLEQNFRAVTTMSATLVKKEKNEGGLILLYRFTDTASCRAIATKLIFAGSTLHQITAPYDTTIGMQGWKKDFFESFSAADSVKEKSIFTDNFDNLLNDLVSQDTAQRAMANRALNNGLGMQKAWIPQFTQLLNSPQLKNINEDSRAQLFVNAGTLRSDGIIEPYKKLYLQYTDSFYLQLSLLKGLAYVKSPKAVRAFSELLLKEPPLTGDENAIQDVFSVLHDSIPLCKSMFPELLQLTRYEEFRNPVYTLLASLVKEKQVNVTRFGKSNEGTIADALLALKRYNPAQRNESDGNLSHLDRMSREIAENIRASLEVMRHNMLGPQAQAAAEHARPTHPLVHYAVILAPLHQKNARVRDFFSRLLRLRSQELVLPAVVSLLRNNVDVADSIVTEFSRDPLTRAYFYSELEKYGITSRFDKHYLSQRLLVESLLQSHRELQNLYGNKLGRDSLNLVKILPASNKYQEGDLYVYSVGKNKFEQQWCAVFVPENKKEVSSRMEVISSGYYVNRSNTEEQNINELINYFRLSYRKRAMGGNGA